MKTSQRIGLLLATLVLGGVPAAGASAALKKFDLVWRTQANDPNVSPNPETVIPRNVRDQNVARIDSTGGPHPVLRKLLRAEDFTITVHVPALLQDVFVSLNFRDGPGILAQIHGNPVPAFTGTGNTAAGTTTRWGIVTGWTQTGSAWCNSNPGVICSLAMYADEDTVDGRFNSEFYDLGTWFFHGTGFIASPFIASYATNSPGNTTTWVRGSSKQDGTVPALPLLGVVVLSASLFAGGVAALFRQRKP